MGFFKFSLHIAANLLCSCFYLFGTIIELHAMHEKKKYYDFLNGKYK